MKGITQVLRITSLLLISLTSSKNRFETILKLVTIIKHSKSYVYTIHPNFTVDFKYSDNSSHNT